MARRTALAKLATERARLDRLRGKETLDSERNPEGRAINAQIYRYARLKGLRYAVDERGEMTREWVRAIRELMGWPRQPRWGGRARVAADYHHAPPASVTAGESAKRREPRMAGERIRVK